MDHATIALILSIIAVILAASKWIYDFHADRAEQDQPTLEDDAEIISESGY